MSLYPCFLNIIIFMGRDVFMVNFLRLSNNLFFRKSKDLIRRKYQIINLIYSSNTGILKDGKLNLSTKVPSLENYEQSFEIGLDPKTKLPCASASISDEFYNYKLKTTHGELTLSGKAIFKNTFTPSVKPGLCEALVPSYRGMMEQREESEFAAFSAAGAIALGGAGYFVGGEITKIGIALIAGGGAAIAVPVLASQLDKLDTPSSTPALSHDETISVLFYANKITSGV